MPCPPPPAWSPRLRILLLCLLLLAGGLARAAGRRTVRVGVFTFYPAIFWDPQAGTARGFYPDMLREVADREHWDLQFVPGTWAEGLDRARRGEVDLLTSVAFSPERERFLAFGKEPSFTVWSLLYTRPGQPIQSILDVAGHRVGVMHGDMNGLNFRKLCEAFRISCTFVELDSFTEVLGSVAAGAVDAGVTPSLFGYAKEHEFKVVRSSVVVAPFDLFFAAPAGRSRDLLATLDGYLRAGRGDPRSGYQQAVDRWLHPRMEARAVPAWVWRAALAAGCILLASRGGLLVFRHRLRLGLARIRALNADLERQLEERRRSGEALLEAHRFSEQIIRNAQEGITVYDLDLRLVVWNPFMEQLSGVSEEAVLGRRLPEAFPFLRDTPIMANLERALAGEVVHSEDIRIDVPGAGKPGWTADVMAPFRNAKGEIVGVIGTVSDITARKRSENQLREILHSLDGLVYVADLATHETLFVNRFGQEIWGDFTGQPCWCNLQAGQAGPCEFCTNDRLLDAAGAPAGVVVWEFQNTVTGRWYECRDSAIPWPDRGLVRLEVAIDITERKRLEAQERLLQAQLQQAQKMESLGILAGGIAHDMNNVLGAILGLASAHVAAQPEAGGLRRAFETIIKAAERGGQMVKGLLSFARQSPAENRELDLNGLLHEETRLLEHTTLAKVRLVTDFDPDLRPILGDAGALTHAFMNLCVNAVDAMPAGGTLTLSTRNLEGAWIEVRVADTGTGMDPEVLAKAADPFFTTKGVGKGTGLGLSTVYSTVKAHQGAMEIQSEAGRGTRVLLRFPARAWAGPARAALAGPEGPGAQGLKALRVLVVDDDDLVQASTRALLEALGHAVTVAGSGEAALGWLAGARPDVVILDLNMPGLGGAGTLPRLRALHPEVPVLLATGRVDQASLDLARTFARVALLSKPYGREDLLESLRDC